ncbi:antitoxin protein [Methylovulum psychrotolerans]|nr:antitoxin protein [Methylovulum psychrotolerans]MBT9099408.1 antitoxin protein [Methylovulum psychrotolerans]
MTQIYNPVHLGETLHEDALPALGLTISEVAKQLGVYPQFDLYLADNQ